MRNHGWPCCRSCVAAGRTTSGSPRRRPCAAAGSPCRCREHASPVLVPPPPPGCLGAARIGGGADRAGTCMHWSGQGLAQVGGGVGMWLAAPRAGGLGGVGRPQARRRCSRCRVIPWSYGLLPNIHSILVNDNTLFFIGTSQPIGYLNQCCCNHIFYFSLTLSNNFILPDNKLLVL